LVADTCPFIHEPERESEKRREKNRKDIFLSHILEPDWLLYD